MKAPILLSLFIAVALGAVACSDDNGCEAALGQTVNDTKAVCSEDGYKSTPFCGVCAAAGFYSTSGPTDCKCKLLAFDQSFCTYPGDAESLAGVRGAIDWANQDCATFSLPNADGGTEGSTGDASEAGASTLEGGND